MGTWLKPVGIVLAVLLLGFIAQRLITPSEGSETEETTLAAFLDRLEAGQIESATLQPGREEIEFMPTFGAGPETVYEAAYPESYSDSLIAALRKEDVPFDVDDGSSVADWAYYLLPFALWIAFWIWLARRLGGLATRIDTLAERLGPRPLDRPRPEPPDPAGPR